MEAIAPNNLVTKARYDELNRVAESVDSLGNSTKYRYDEVGNRSWMEDRRGTEWSYQYYDNNLLQRVEAAGADGTGYWVEYTYDEAGNRMAVKDSGNEIKYNFEGETYLPDPLNRINSINRSFDGTSYQTAYQYSPAGLVTGILYPEALSMLEYQYNKDLNQLTAVTGFTAPNGINYNDDGSLAGINYANGAKAVYNYDANRRLDDMKVTVGGQELLNLDYSYDEVGNIKTVNDGGKLKLYEYDKNNQLTKAVTPGTFMETNPTPGTAALKTGDILGNGIFEFTPILSGLMGLDYHASSIGIDFGGVASAIKVIELAPDKDYSTHRITENTIALYISNDNTNYTLIPRSD
ncbi:MAG: RHS repeat protein, partial [Firmicutes bacterium]|nr:RHS repeat protein [Bacillota bacterium]